MRGRRPHDLPPPRKRLGQHFLTDPRILERIVGALGLKGTETVVEIGPGRGALTDLLAPRCARLVAIEIDRVLAPMLRQRFASDPHVTIVEADVRDTVPGELAAGPYVAIGNVPYYITTPILFHVLRAPLPERAVFLVQREVAARLASVPGTGDYGALSVNVQALAEVEMLFRIAPGAFTPAPSVESALVRITPRAQPDVAPGEVEEFRRFVQAVFAQRRKQLKTILRSVNELSMDESIARIERCGLTPDVRPERLSAAQFAQLWRAVRV